MKCQILFSGKNKKTISVCRLLKILPECKAFNSTGAILWDVVFHNVLKTDK